MPRDEQEHWFVGKTRYGQELKIRDRLVSLGVCNFIPTRVRTVERSGKRIRKEVPVINNLVFLQCTKDVACDLANNCGLPVNYIIDRNTHTLMVVPDKQMDDFRKVFAEGDIQGPTDLVLKVGDRVRVTKGVLTGVEGNVIVSGDKTYILVDIGGLIQARAEIPLWNLEKL